MNLDDRIIAFHKLGEILDSFIKNKIKSKQFNLIEKSITQSSDYNGFLDRKNIFFAIKNIIRSLNYKNISGFLKNYNYDFQNTNKTIGLINAGNIPFVEFNDIFYILISGFNLDIKLSDKNKFLPKCILDILIDVEPRFNLKIKYSNVLPEKIDGVIASGSDLSNSIFRYKYSDIPNILRQNKTSIAVLKGNEGVKDIKGLFLDMFSYYGLGCRNVSKLYVPEKYNFDFFIQYCAENTFLMNNKFYRNNYVYNRSLLKMLNINFLDTGTFLLINTNDIFSPISVINYQYYSDCKNLHHEINFNKIQCFVNSDKCKFGYSQLTDFLDYPDNFDVVSFLIKNF